MSKNHNRRFTENHEETATEIMKRILSEKIVAQSGKKMTVREGICRRIAKNGANGHLPSADYTFRIAKEAPTELNSQNSINNTVTYIIERTLPPKSSKKDGNKP